MVILQTNKIRTILIFIIVLVGIIWIFQKNILSISLINKTNKELVTNKEKVENTTYLEKIDNFIIKEYSKNHVLLHTIKADVYKSFKNSPIQLETVKLVTFDEFQKETLILKSNKAEIFKSGSIHFIGEVEIKTMSGISHQIDTELLVFKEDEINSNRDVFYIGESAKIKAQGMNMNTDNDIINLIGDVEIVQDDGGTLVTKNLFIAHNEDNKSYISKDRTVYKSNQNKVTSDKGVDIDMNSEKTKLFGDVRVLNSFGSSLTSYDLLIDKSNGGEIFKSDSPSHFQSDTVDIKAKKMHYDVIAKKLKLTNGVIANYE